MNQGPAGVLELWLPPRTQFAAHGPLRAALARADRLPDGEGSGTLGIERYFPGLASPLPVAALTRELLAHDAGAGLWLAADPAWARPDINGVRLMACGHLQLDQAEAEALAAPLREVFAEAGMSLEVTSADHWHVRLPEATVVPALPTPQQAMGEDLTAHLPAGPGGKPWRVLFNDLQVMLHQNPLNRERQARRLPPVNTLWLWGGGRLPDVVHSILRGVVSDDLTLRALAARAGIPCLSREPESVLAAGAGWLLDAQDAQAARLEAQWWPALVPQLAHTPIAFNFADGGRWLHRPWHRWRVWRRALR
ncbi:MAG TPA: phosphoglycerate mutase [Rhodanobacter sp.]|jgi:hypothetical protein|nr:phosphoglycerate mutase [Rhodanobacter sp.]